MLNQEHYELSDRRGALSVFFRAGVVALTLTVASAQAVAQGAAPIKDRHIGVSREAATKLPRSEADQALVDGWPLYRTVRGQTAFNDAMATLRATEAAAPSPQAFRGCVGLDCNLSLPALGTDGWLPPGRLWVSPTEYVLIAHSPRLGAGQSYRRRAYREMRYFVFHEFHNSSHNTDPYDTISSHKSSVFVPLYMSKQGIDAKRRRFVVVVQVAPYDVVSVHAVNHGSAGPGMEVAKNKSDAIEPLQEQAGILVATILKTAAPHLRVVNHRDAEGLPMLNAYERRLATLRARAGDPTVTLPFVPAPAQRVAAATGGLDAIVGKPSSGLTASLTPAPDQTPMLIGPIRLATRPVCATAVANATACRQPADARGVAARE